MPIVGNTTFGTPNINIPDVWRLSTTETSIVRALLDHAEASAAFMAEAAKTTVGAARVHIHRIRQKISGHGLEIETVAGKGWRLVGREDLRRALAVPANRGE